MTAPAEERASFEHPIAIFPEEHYQIVRALARSAEQEHPPCQSYPDLWWPGKGETPGRAIEICKTRCPMLEQCLAYALEADEDDGVWGGTTPQERKAMKKTNRQDTPPLPTPLLAPAPEDQTSLRHPLDRITPAYKKELLDTVEHAAANKPRSLQRSIGPSGLGNPCNRCLGYALAQVPQRPGDSQWLQLIGTAMHTELEGIFERRNEIDPERWMTEQRLLVGAILGKDISGSADLFDRYYGVSLDWKLVGDNTLNKARKGSASVVYIKQGHTYGKGHEDAGRTVRHVAIAFLPRNARTIYEAVIKTFPYDRTIAEASLKRASDIAYLGEQHGWYDVLSRLSRDPDCWDCKYDRQHTPDEAKWMGYIA